MSNNTKYRLSVVGIIIMFYAAFKYLESASASQQVGSGITKHVIIGVILLISSGIVGILFTYFRHKRFMYDSEQKDSGAELSALSVLAAENKKNIIIEIYIDDETFKNFDQNPVVRVHPSLFHKPIRTSDTVLVYNSAVNQDEFLIATIKKIDMYNEFVVLQKSAMV